MVPSRRRLHCSVSPWTITHRPFENNVHKIAYAVLPLLALLRVVNPGPAGVAAGVTFLVGSLMSNVSVSCRIQPRHQMSNSMWLSRVMSNVSVSCHIQRRHQMSSSMWLSHVMSWCGASRIVSNALCNCKRVTSCPTQACHVQCGHRNSEEGAEGRTVRPRSKREGEGAEQVETYIARVFSKLQNCAKGLPRQPWFATARSSEKINSDKQDAIPRTDHKQIHELQFTCVSVVARNQW